MLAEEKLKEVSLRNFQKTKVLIIQHLLLTVAVYWRFKNEFTVYVKCASSCRYCSGKNMRLVIAFCFCLEIIIMFHIWYVELRPKYTGVIVQFCIRFFSTAHNFMKIFPTISRFFFNAWSSYLFIWKFVTSAVHWRRLQPAQFISLYLLSWSACNQKIHLTSQECKKRGEDYSTVKMREWTAEEVEQWEKRKKKRKNPDEGFADYHQAAERKYQKLCNQIKPDMEAYKKEKERLLVLPFESYNYYYYYYCCCCWLSVNLLGISWL